MCSNLKMDKGSSVPIPSKGNNGINNIPSIQSMRDILSNEISKVHSKDLLNKFYAMNNANKENQKRNQVNLLQYSFLNHTSKNEKKMNKNSSTGCLRPKLNIKRDEINYNELYSNNNVRITNQSRDIYQKEMALKLRRELRLEQLRQNKKKEEMKEIKPKPTIDPMSKVISKRTPPLIKRLDKIEEKTKEKLRKIQLEVMEEEMSNYCPEMYINNKIKYNTFEEWISQNEKWNNEKREKLERLKEEIKEFEGDNELKFRPSINKKSEMIVQSKGMTLLERLSCVGESREEYAKRKIEENLPTFTPQINKKYKIRDTYYDFMNENQEEIYNSLLK